MRLAAQAKGGFYPTPGRVVEMIATLVDTPRLSYCSRGKTLRILDPCCGAGEALSQLAECLGRPNGLPIETFGVELHRDRAEEARGILDHSLASDLFRTSMANGSFGLLYLNPPYDWDAGDEKRVEHRFLTHCTRYLAEDGLLVFIVPRSRLAVSARYLATHYQTLRCWAFPRPEREAYDQVVLMGYRKADPSPNAYAEGRVREWAYGEPEGLSPHDYPVYSPSITPAGDILFATRTVDPVAAAREARTSGLWASRGSNRRPLARRGQPHPPPDAPAQGTHGHAGGCGVPGQPGAGGRRQAHPGQGTHFQGDDPCGGHPSKGDIPGEAEYHGDGPGPCGRGDNRHRRIIRPAPGRSTRPRHPSTGKRRGLCSFRHTPQ